MTELLNDQIRGQIRGLLENMQNPVKFIVFSQGEDGSLECQMCHETRQLIEEVGALSDKIDVEVRDFVTNAELAEAYGVDKIPAIVILQNGPEPKDFGVRLYGIPSGYEFTSLIEDILLVSSGQTGLTERTIQELERLDRPVHIQVYVTPT